MSHDKILDWLHDRGYPLELRVGKAFRDAGWEAEHATFYNDPLSGKVRELDLYVRRTGSALAVKARAHVGFAVECKVSQDKPWIVLASRPFGATRTYPANFAPGALAQVAVVHAVGVDSADAPELFRVGDRVGHSIVKAFSDGKSGDPTAPYAAVQSAVAGATALNRDFALFTGRWRDSLRSISLAIPLVVVDGSLFEYYLDSQGNESLVEVERAVVSSPLNGGPTEAVTVHVVRSACLDAFLSTVTPQATAIAARIASEASNIIASLDRTAPDQSGPRSHPPDDR